MNSIQNKFELSCCKLWVGGRPGCEAWVWVALSCTEDISTSRAQERGHKRDTGQWTKTGQTGNWKLQSHTFGHLLALCPISAKRKAKKSYNQLNCEFGLTVVSHQFGFLWSLNSFKAVILSISNFVQAEKIQNDPNLLLHDCEKYLLKLTWGLCVSVCQLKSSWNRLQWRQRWRWQKCKFWSGDKICVPPSPKFYSQWQSW